MLSRRAVATAVALVTAIVVAACGAPAGAPSGAGAAPPTLTISAIPDQDPQQLQRLYDQVSGYLGGKLGVPVRYQPVTDYTASVTAFRRGDLQLVFFGGLTGVQARLQLPGSVPLAQRDVDESFRSVFVAGSGAGVGPVADVAGLSAVRGKSLTFGSEVSTSGRLMPQYFLTQAGVAPADVAGGAPGFSGSHDATIKLVEAGTYQVGALNASVWDARVKAGQVDPAKVTEVFRTPTYHDYHWLGRPDLDATFGAGFTDRARETLLGIDGVGEGPEAQQERDILAVFTAAKFVPTAPENYADIETVARQLGLVQ